MRADLRLSDGIPTPIHDAVPLLPVPVRLPPAARPPRTTLRLVLLSLLLTGAVVGASLWLTGCDPPDCRSEGCPTGRRCAQTQWPCAMSGIGPVLCTSWACVSAAPASLIVPTPTDGGTP